MESLPHSLGALKLINIKELLYPKIGKCGDDVTQKKITDSKKNLWMTLKKCKCIQSNAEEVNAAYY